VIVVALLLAGWGALGVSSIPLHAGDPLAPAATAPVQNGATTRSAYLTANATSVSAGNPIRFVLRIAPMNCTSGVPPNESVVQVEFHLGDGFTFIPSPVYAGWSDSGVIGCTSAPWNATFPLTYTYRSPGTVSVNATVLWADGTERTSNSVGVVVTAPSSAVQDSIEGWLVGSSIAVLVTLVACLLLRERLPPPPSLPPRET